MGDVIVTNAKTLPAATANQIMVVLPYSGTPTPTNRLSVGVYYSFNNKWYDFFAGVYERIADLFVPKTRTITINSQTFDLSQNRTYTVTTSTPDLAEVLAEGNDGNGLAIENIADPTNAQDAATKAYVDNSVVDPAGADTQVQFNDGGAFGADSTLVFNKTSKLLTAQAANLSGETASRIAIIDASKNVKSADTATYPSLTELSYVKGVTSAIQTQLDNRVVLLGTVTASNSPTVDFEGLSSTYPNYYIIYSDLVPQTNAVALWVRVGTGTPSVYQSGGTDYAWVRNFLQVAGTGTVTTSVVVGDGNDAQIILFGAGVSSNAGCAVNGVIDIYDPSQATVNHYFNHRGALRDSVGNTQCLSGMGIYLSNTAVTAVRIMMSSGNIASGLFKLYGLR